MQDIKLCALGLTKNKNKINFHSRRERRSGNRTPSSGFTCQINPTHVGNDSPASSHASLPVQNDGLLVVTVAQVGREVRIQVLVLAGLRLAGDAGDKYAGTWPEMEEKILFPFSACASKVSKPAVVAPLKKFSVSVSCVPMIEVVSPQIISRTLTPVSAFRLSSSPRVRSHTSSSSCLFSRLQSSPLEEKKERKSLKKENWSVHQHHCAPWPSPNALKHFI